ncbi:protein lethal(2)essential for life-like [Agrilus planipennis]|uniref:Protein lethal(2)essential for life-like n=1 Tax=Agrilus planipennis TaxID=224129 RepID=A0A1W4W2T3_AGRPL|nr:protein lethal(2)essential for life-like [Agrilus planipennis]
MSILLWDPLRPSRIVDQQFGLGLDPEDLLSPLTLPWESHVARWPIENYFRPWRSQAAVRDTGSTITADKDKFQVSLDVQHFKPDEIKVTASGNTLTVEGKHEEKQDEHGYISRHFVRKYVLPEGHDVNQVQSRLSSDGVLTLTAPKKAIGGPDQKTIPIQQTGQPSRPIENKKEEKK